MEKKYFQKGKDFLDYKEFLDELDNFITLYESRPIKNNKGGMQFSSMFYFFLILKKKIHPL